MFFLVLVYLVVSVIFIYALRSDSGENTKYARKSHVRTLNTDDNSIPSISNSKSPISLSSRFTLA